MLNLFAFPWWLATVVFGLSDAAEVAAITGAFGALSSLIAAFFGYQTMKAQLSRRKIELHEDVGPVVGPPDKSLDHLKEGGDV